MKRLKIEGDERESIELDEKSLVKDSEAFYLKSEQNYNCNNNYDNYNCKELIVMMIIVKIMIIIIAKNDDYVSNCKELIIMMIMLTIAKN